MATKTITALTAVFAGDLDDTARVAVDDNVTHTRKATIAQLRTQIFSGAGVPLTCGALTAASGAFGVGAVGCGELTATTGKFSDAGRFVKTVAGLFSGVTLRNDSPSTAAFTRFQIGNQTIDHAFTIDVLGNNYTGDAYGVTILNQNNAVLRLGGYGTVALTLGNGGAATFAAGLTATGGFGCNGKAAQTAYASGGLLAGVVAALIANGILST